MNRLTNSPGPTGIPMRPRVFFHAIITLIKKYSTYTNYTHTGSAKLEILEQTTEGSINPVTEKYVYSYDHAGRLTSIDHSYNTNPAVRIAQNSYDNTGRLVTNHALEYLIVDRIHISDHYCYIHNLLVK